MNILNILIEYIEQNVNSFRAILHCKIIDQRIGLIHIVDGWLTAADGDSIE